MNSNLLDDNIEWENEGPENASLFYTNDESEVVMIRTFNVEEQAYLCAARLKDSGIDAHVVGSATSQMTPFAYGNLRLYVAEAQALEAQKILAEMDARNDVLAQPNLSSTRIVMILVGGIMVTSVIIAVLQYFFEHGFYFKNFY
jgi:hypothetical protein